MIESTVTIQWQHGLHMRPASELAKLCKTLDCQVKISYGESCVDAQSVLGLAMLAVPCGATIKIFVSGAAEKEAHTALNEFFQSDFD
ncbi:MAG: HPr family phosphocarrier protein [Spirochaetales bacterium]|nr:HPr family phosphocarrier protein [Spirochaetales bacterium]MBR6199917.1 HPr family phosphocarrier protein [Spirochaetales bacterium]